MKKKTIQYHFLYFILVLIVPLQLLSAPKDSKEKQIIIWGKIAGASKVELIKFPSYYMYNGKTFTTNYSCEVKDSNFIFHLPAIDAPRYISIIFLFQPGKNNKVLDFYLIEPGDSIYIKEGPNGITFSGKGSDRFECQYKIKQIQPIINKETFSDTYQVLRRRDLMHDSLNNRKLAILNSFKAELSNNAFQILLSDCINEKFLSYYRSTTNLFPFLKQDSAQKQEVIRYYKEHYFNQRVDTTNIPAILYSRQYMEFVFAKIKFDCWIKVNQYRQVPEDVFNEIYHEIDEHYSGILKQKLLTGFFVRQRIFNDSLSKLANLAIKQVTHPLLHEILLEVLRKTKGVTAYNFSLKDSSDKTVRLSDFRGKVVVLDFWYTACTWCPVMAGMIKPIADEKGPEAIFITICLDKDKSMWKKSLKTGRFTSENELNLYTGGDSFDHALVKYYSIYTYPYVMIIDGKGRISSTNPAPNTGTEEAIAKLREAIRDALQESK